MELDRTEADPATTNPAPAVDTNSIRHTLRTALLLCLICSVLVSVFAVGLRGVISDKKKRFRQENILKAAGLWNESGDVDMDAMFAESGPVRARVYDFVTDTLTDDETDIDTRKTSRDPDLSKVIEDDIAGIRRRENRTVIYEVHEDGALRTLVLPIRGYGLWSTLWGFIALDVSEINNGPDRIQILGITYFDQKETPGLGGEVDNPRWKAKWVGKRAFDSEWNVKIAVVKGAKGLYQVDALSGATITSRGVSNMLAYWLGEEGFGPYLRQLSGTAANPGDNEEPAGATNGDEGQKHD